MGNLNIFIAALLCFKISGAFDLPKNGCQSEININHNHYNVTNTYHVGDAYPTDAHYDVYGNLFFVESGRNDKGFYFNANVIKFKTTAPEKIPGKIFVYTSIRLKGTSFCIRD